MELSANWVVGTGENIFYAKVSTTAQKNSCHERRQPAYRYKHGLQELFPPVLPDTESDLLPVLMNLTELFDCHVCHMP